MSSVGPQMPSNLTKRKRSASPIGPTLPTSNPDALDLESSEDEYAPPPKKPSPPRRILGPSLPPANLSERPSYPANPPNPKDDSSDSSDDDYGPSLPPPPGSAAEATLHQERAREASRRDAAKEPEKPKRDDWMMVPPSDSDWTSRVDPTRIKNRKFASGKGAKAPGENSGISAIWTETPAEKRQRLEDEVLGRKDKASSGRGGVEREVREETDEDRRTAKRIKEYNEKHRGKSLVEMNEESGTRAGDGREKEDDPSKRGFDREKDMAIGGRMGNGQRKEMLAKAADFGSRFQKGKYL